MIVALAAAVKYVGLATVNVVEAATEDEKADEYHFYPYPYPSPGLCLALSLCL